MTLTEYTLRGMLSRPQQDGEAHRAWQSRSRPATLALTLNLWRCLMKEFFGSLGSTTAFALFAALGSWAVFNCGLRNDWCLLCGPVLVYFLSEYGRSLTGSRE